jgi:hypothetical protein
VLRFVTLKHFATLMLCSCSWLCKAADGYSFTATGTIRLSYYYTKEATLGRIEDARFEAEVKRGGWYIKAIPLSSSYLDPAIQLRVQKAIQERFGAKGLPPQLPSVFETGFDGVDVYSFRNFGAGHPPGEAVIRRDAVPYNDRSSYATPIWLAIASWTFFETNVASKIKPLWPLEDVEGLWYQGVIFPVNVVRSKQHPGIVTSLVQNLEGTNYAIIPGSQPNVITNHIYEPPFDRGFTKCKYAVLSTTNINGFELPREFRFQVFYPKSDDRKTNGIRLYLSYDGIVNDYGFQSDRKDFRPELKDQRPTVVDRRYSNKSEPSALALYEARNSRWPDANDPELQRQASRRVEVMKSIINPNTQPEKGRKRFVVLLFLFGSLLAGAVLCIKCSKRAT